MHYCFYGEKERVRINYPKYLLVIKIFFIDFVIINVQNILLTIIG